MRALTKIKAISHYKIQSKDQFKAQIWYRYYQLQITKQQTNISQKSILKTRPTYFRDDNLGKMLPWQLRNDCGILIPRYFFFTQIIKKDRKLDLATTLSPKQLIFFHY